jgi:hypothetical protein
MHHLLPLACAVLILSAAPAAGEVVDSAPGGFTLKIVLEVEAPAAKAYSSLIDAGAWWDPVHTFSGHASNLTLEATAGGCFCEKLPSGGSVQHLTVVYADPGRLLRLNGGLGPMQDMAVAGSLSFAIAESAGKSTVTLTYKVGGYLPGGFDAMAKAVDGVLTGAMQRLKRYIETGRP